MRASRLVVLIIALAAGGTAAWLVQGPPEQPVQISKPTPSVPLEQVLVAAREIGVGQRVVPGDVEWRSWPASSTSQLIRKADLPNAEKDIFGALARAALAVGQPIQEAQLIRANGSGYLAAMLPRGMRAVATEVSPESGAAGFILPNDKVDVLISMAEKKNGNEVYKIQTVLKNVRVLAIDQTVEEKNGQKTVLGKTATLELTPWGAETLTLARRLGTVSLSLRSLADSVDGIASADFSEDLRPSSGVNIVRFGQVQLLSP